MKSHIYRLIFVSAILTTLVTGCGNKEGRKIAVFYGDASPGSGSTQSIRGSLDRKFSGGKADYKTHNSDSDQQVQTEQIENEVREGANILVVDMADNTSDGEAGHIVDVARNADIPVVFFGNPVDDSELESYSKAVYIGSDYRDKLALQGEMIGQYLLDNYELIDLNEDGKISYVMYSEYADEDVAGEKKNIEEIDRLLSTEGKPAIEFYDPMAQQTSVMTSDAGEHMTEILQDYNDANANMIELVVADNDGAALGAVGALQEAGYNGTSGTRIVPVFGIDAGTDTVNAISGGMMAGTVRQNEEYVVEIIDRVCRNMLTDTDKFDGIDEKIISGKNRINIPYEVYYGNGI